MWCNVVRTRCWFFISHWTQTALSWVKVLCLFDPTICSRLPSFHHSSWLPHSWWSITTTATRSLTRNVYMGCNNLRSQLTHAVGLLMRTGRLIAHRQTWLEIASSNILVFMISMKISSGVKRSTVMWSALHSTFSLVTSPPSPQIFSY